ncbi:hypothetical protein GDO81_020083 [Engystomops pustulosus]|uniref:Uncharacterized protein n=1 Tax=Engystomops pustulosus TaxID=76066 RepID=A0AAV6YXK5_ENGPU|nr:hypothetical protein GDO81_020083 [Engystomops pustulosus]
MHKKGGKNGWHQGKTLNPHHGRITPQHGSITPQHGIPQEHKEPDIQETATSRDVTLHRGGCGVSMEVNGGIPCIAWRPPFHDSRQPAAASGTALQTDNKPRAFRPD